MSGQDRVKEFICKAELFWKFVLVFCLVQYLLLGVSVPVVDPGSATYVILIVDAVAVTVFLAITIGIFIMCGYLSKFW